MPNVDRRDQQADIANDLGLQPALLVSARKRVTAVVPAYRGELLDDVGDRFS